jgi:predicted class III extradiol MEMO1 family dioxygenase
MTATAQQGHQQHFKHVQSSKQATCHGQLTISALLMVTMLVRKACMSLLSSNQSSYQGV